MKKKNYMSPKMTIVQIRHQVLLAGSANEIEMNYGDSDNTYGI